MHTSKQSDAVGLSDIFLAKQLSTKFLKSSDQSPLDKDGGSFCAIWYKALMAFILKRGGFLSAENIWRKNKPNMKQILLNSKYIFTSQLHVADK